MAKTQLHKNLRPQKEKRVYLTHSIFMNGLSDADIKLLKKYNRYFKCPYHGSTYTAGIGRNL